MSYISCVIKEPLRLHPLAATARHSEPGSGLTVCTPADEYYYYLDGARKQASRNPAGVIEIV